MKKIFLFFIILSNCYLLIAQSEMTVEDDFRNNNRNWPNINNENVTMGLHQPYNYVLQHKRDFSGWDVYRIYDGIDLQRHITFESKIEFSQGNTSAGYGLLIGENKDVEDSDNTMFFICKNGSFVIRRYVNSKKATIDIVDWRKSKSIKTSDGSVNHLKFVQKSYKKDNELKQVHEYYINGTLVYQTNYGDDGHYILSGKAFGIMVNREMAVSIKLYKITGYFYN